VRELAGFLSEFVRPLVEGGDVHVGEPVGRETLSMWEVDLDRHAEATVAIDELRSRFAAALVVRPPPIAFSVADLRAWEKKHGRVPRGSFVALRTDMYKDWDSNPEHFKRSPFPAWAFETIRFLYEQRGVTATGHESLDTDITDKMDSETYILQRGHYQIEAMANLDKVPPKGALIVVTWPKVRKGLGFPARAFAIVP